MPDTFSAEDLTAAAVRDSFTITLADGTEKEGDILVRDLPIGDMGDLDRRLGEAQREGEEAVLELYDEIFDDYLIEPDVRASDLGLATAKQVFMAMQRAWGGGDAIAEAQQDLGDRVEDPAGN